VRRSLVHTFHGGPPIDLKLPHFFIFCAVSLIRRNSHQGTKYAQMQTAVSDK